MQPHVLAWLRELTYKPGVNRPEPSDFISVQGKVAMGFAGMLMVCGTPRDLFWWNLSVLLLAEQPGRHILRCPECDTIFYRVQKQAYCSRTCSNRVMQRRFRERHKAEAT